jgi:hypothetical protein
VRADIPARLRPETEPPRREPEKEVSMPTPDIAVSKDEKIQ